MRNMLQLEHNNLDRPLTIIPLESLLAELDFCRHRAERLLTMNELHRRLAGANDLPEMVEALSVWLTPYVAHDLIAYNNPGPRRQYLFCSCHGPRRQEVQLTAERIFGNVVSETYEGSWEEDNYFIQLWHIDQEVTKGQLLLLRQNNPIDSEEETRVREALEIMEEPLRRALNYEELYEQASRDSLTGLANRRVFDSRITALIESARRHNHSMTLVAMDLDRFKQINDTMGHLKGDEILREVAKILASSVRRSDLLVRMGGDEFLLVLPETDMAAAQALAERLCQAVANLDVCIPGGDKLGISIGLAQWQQELTKDEWLRRADEVLYHAKATGRSRVCIA